MKNYFALGILLLTTSGLVGQAGIAPRPEPRPGNLPEILVGRDMGPNEQNVKKLAVNNAILEGFRILLGREFNPNSPGFRRALERVRLEEFGRLEGGEGAFNVRRSNNRFEVEVRVRPDWPKITQFLRENRLGSANPGENLNSIPRDNAPQTLPNVVMGLGRDRDPGKALEIAEKDVLRIAMLRLLGPQGGAVSQQLRQLWEVTSFKDYTKSLSDQKDVTQKLREQVEVTVNRTVDWDKLRSLLENQGFKLQDSGMSMAENNPQGTRESGSTLGGGMTNGTQTADWGEVTESEKNTILKYLDTLSFLVYYNEKSTSSPTILKSAVNQANMVLTKSGITVFDIDRVEKAKATQLKVFEESRSGSGVNYIQYIAQSLNADVYAQIDLLEGAPASTTNSAETTPEAQTIAILTTEIFDSSSGQLLGSFPVNILATAEKTGAQNLNSLVLNVVEKAMTQAVIQSKEQMQKALVRGMRYDLIIQNTTDSRLMSRFLDKLKENVKQIKVLSSSPSEYRYEVYYIGLVSDLESLLYKTTDSLPGLEGLRLVIASGKTLTMETGQ